ncbi:trypco2 family protein [Streptomyces maoxianensis]|uniref:Trypco2 family protein n=1 Tax=Streptomyces maoxianensis TaxID=1459942 RepID=A0ABV9G6S6_9ACTN
MERVGLKEAIQAAYEQLHAAVTEIPLRDGLDFRYESIELELNVEVDEATEHQGDVKFWVVGGGGKKARANRSTHLVKVAITPLWRVMEEANARGVQLSDRELRIGSGALRNRASRDLRLSDGEE